MKIPEINNNQPWSELKGILKKDEIGPNLAKKLKFYSEEIGIQEKKEKWIKKIIETQQKNIKFGVIGDLSSGKTSFIGFMLQKSYKIRFQHQDLSKHELQREITIKTIPYLLEFKNEKNKSYIINLIDTPGHIDYIGEIQVAIDMANLFFLVIDSVSGISTTGKEMLFRCLKENKKIILLINKIDRLIIEFELKPNDLFYKLNYIINEINKAIEISFSIINYFNPLNGNVFFSSIRDNWIFSLEFIANQYNSIFPTIMMEGLQNLFWGDIEYFMGRFITARNSKSLRTFSLFVLEPIYKIYFTILKGDLNLIKKLSVGLGISLTTHEINQDNSSLLKLFFLKYLKGTDSISKIIQKQLNINEPSINNSKELNSYRFIIHIFKRLIGNEKKNLLFGKIIHGTVKKNTNAVIIDSNRKKNQIIITKIYAANLYPLIEIDFASANSLILLEDINEFSTEYATIYDPINPEVIEGLEISPKKFLTPKAIMQISVNPKNPEDFLELLENIKKTILFYKGLNLSIKNNRYLISGTNELFLDSFIYDLSLNFSCSKFYFSEPTVPLLETIISSSPAYEVNGPIKISLLVEPLPPSLGHDLYRGLFEDFPINSPEFINHLHNNYNWDLSTIKSIIAIGPYSNGTNILICQSNTPYPTSLKTEIEKAIHNGFIQAVEKGPLFHENLMFTCVKILDINFSDAEINSELQLKISKITHNLIHQALLNSKPRIIEPIYRAEIIALNSFVPLISSLICKRRGRIDKNIPSPLTSMSCIFCYIPAIEILGLDPDLRTFTNGYAHSQSYLSRWEVLPGNPLAIYDSKESITDKSQRNALSISIYLKFRKEKGLDIIQI